MGVAGHVLLSEIDCPRSSEIVRDRPVSYCATHVSSACIRQRSLAAPYVLSGERSEAICGRLSRFNHRELPGLVAPVGRACVSLTVFIGNRFEWSYQVSARIRRISRFLPLSLSPRLARCCSTSVSLQCETYSIYVHRGIERMRASSSRGSGPPAFARARPRYPAASEHGPRRGAHVLVALAAQDSRRRTRRAAPS